MKESKKKLILIGTVLLLLALALTLALRSSLSQRAQKSKAAKTEHVIHRDLYDVLAEGELRAVTLEGSPSYFRYRGLERGYEYHHALSLADSLGIRLRITTKENPQALRQAILDGEADLIAYPMPVYMDQDSLLYCGVVSYMPLVLLERGSTKKKSIDSLEQLQDQKVYCTYLWQQQYLESLNAGIKVVRMNSDSISEEDLIRSLNKGAIPYVATSERVAAYSLSYYPALRQSLVLGAPSSFCWAVSTESPILASYINRRSYIYRSQEDESVRIARNMRLFESSRRSSSNGLILSIQDGRVSALDEIFKRHGQKEGIDWRLLAAIAYTESGFDSTLVSRQGAMGIMQVMPETLTRFTGKTPDQATTDDILDAAIKVLKNDERILRKVAQEDRDKFVLAAYNAGLGHVRDAQRLAEKFGRDPLKWDGNVEDFIRLKSQEVFYQDSLSRNGYLNGEETVKFVHDVLNRYETIKQAIP